MTLFEHYQEKTKNTLNLSLSDVSEVEIIDYLKSHNKPGTKNPDTAPKIEESEEKEDSEEIEPQEGDLIAHENGKNYRFTNGSWLPVEK